MGGDTKMYRVGDTETHMGGHINVTSLTDKQSDRLIDFTERCSYRGGAHLKCRAS